MMYGSEFMFYAATILFLICFSTYASYRGSITEYQRMEMIISTGLFIIIFGLIGGRVLKDDMIRQNISAASLVYVNLYYWTFSSVNSILS